MPWKTTLLQRNLTLDFIAKRRLPVRLVWLRQGAIGLNVVADASVDPGKLSTDPEEWRQEANLKNLGVRLADGFIEVRIQADNETWINCLFEACKHLRVDARAAYSPSGKPVSSILLSIDQPETIEGWRDLWPRGFVNAADKWVETKFEYSRMPTPREKALWQDSRPLPGSIVRNELIVWRPLGKPEADDELLGLEDLESYPVVATSMAVIVRAIAYATLIYWIRIYLDGLTVWDATLIRIIGGWLARAILEGQEINAQGKSLESVCWSAIDHKDTALDLIAFLKNAGADRDVIAAFERARIELQRTPDTKVVPGWAALETMLGLKAKLAVRRAFRAGIDIDAIERLAEQYILDISENDWIDRDALMKGVSYRRRSEALNYEYENQLILIKGKKKRFNPFRLYAASSMRVDVQRSDFFPGSPPGAILRYSPVYGVLGPEEQRPDEYKVFNTYPGFLIKPIEVIDTTIMSKAVSLFDHMLGLLTMNNDGQMLWIKKWIAWIIRFPHIKQQVCPVFIGGQGIGKSIFGTNVMNSLFGGMAGTAEAASLTDNKFVIAPFLGKLVTFIDEVRMETIGAINVIKRLVRSDWLSGQMKFKDQRDYYLPSRLILAANHPEIGLTPEDALDRALFFIMSYTAENMRKTINEFQIWSNGHKPFYNELIAALNIVSFRQHLMRYFTEIEVAREELEDLSLSSRDDENVVRSTLSKPREIARAIIASAHVLAGYDITAWFKTEDLRAAIQREDGKTSKITQYDVMREFEHANVVEPMGVGRYRFRYCYGTLLEKISEAHRLKLDPLHALKPGEDFGPNTVENQFSPPVWRGKNDGKPRSWRHYNDDPDYLEPE
jgi:hypothetical protein